MRVQPCTEVFRRIVLRTWLRLNFQEIFADLDSFQQIDNSPTIIIANHICLHDSAVAMHITDTIGRRFSLAAAAANIRRFPILKKVGFFPIVRGDPISSGRALLSLGRAANHDPSLVIWFFPQGNHVRPGTLVAPERGVLAVMRGAPNAHLVSIGIRYEFLERRRPFVWIKARQIEDAHIHNIDLSRILDSSLEILDKDLHQGSGSYKPILRRDPNTALISNIPCDLRRMAPALNLLELDGKALFDSGVFHGTVSRDQAIRLSRVADRTAGPLYRDLLFRALCNEDGDCP
jgi:hypothetical protein